ncbi:MULTISPECIES: type IV pilin protein [unclassified Marinimicrobium]|uniref:type IV pilin protein n=1 Tax=Marinimicrobium TaxID=359337 RepID=UPI00257D3844|nr:MULTISPECIES: prepilin-type N-terminal cleavage/methylation domain-containing protein [unclassified Marinimicrobium]
MGRFKGFTLVELIAVITVLAVLAAFSLPKLIDFSSSAKRVAAEELAATLSTASSSNLATFILREEYPAAISQSAFPMNACRNARFLLVSGLPAGYRIEAAGSGDGTVSHMATVQCDVVDESDNAIRASFTLHGINPSSS